MFPLKRNMHLFLLSYMFIIMTIIPPLSLSQNTSASEPPFYNDIYCPNNATFQSNATFQRNLNVLLSALASNASQSDGSYYSAMGMGTTSVANGQFLCRADVSSATCNHCIATAATDITRRCPNRTESIIWYDECMLRFTNRYFPPTAVNPGSRLPDPKNVTASDFLSFNRTLFGLLNELVEDAAVSQSAKKFAAGERNFGGSSAQRSVYALVQCVPDLTSAQCRECLVNAIWSLPSCCGGRQGARVLLAWCNVRYELFRFYNFSSTSPLPPPPGDDNKSGSRTVLIVVLVVVPAILLCCVCYFIRKRSRKKYGTLLRENFGDESGTLESLQFSLATIEAATKKFSFGNRIGKGGFGEVYKGILSNGQEIAVKKLSQSSGQGAVEFKTEILLIAKLQHKNLVTLVGFCLEEQEKMLIYEFVSNKSLDYFLFDPHKSRQLNWPKRYKIIEGITQGILYLHKHSRLKVIHRDLKASNVLLDDDMNPRISDFGMARIVAIDQDQGKTNRVVGTYGYMSPEYAMHGQFSEKSDVFSFGVLVLEIISSKRNVRPLVSDHDDLLSYAWGQWRDQTPLNILDQNILETCNHSEVIKCIQLALLCVQEKPNDRPTMVQVVSYLSNSSTELPFPDQPTNPKHNGMVQNMVAGESSSGSALSINEMSISKFIPR